MTQKSKVFDIFKSATRCRDEVRSIGSMWAYFYRDILAKRNITAAYHREALNRYVSSKDLLGKPASTTKSNTDKQLFRDRLTWAAYIGALEIYGCVETTVVVTHTWADGSITYHHREFVHRRRGTIVIDKET